jgi:hypothetical protein
MGVTSLKTPSLKAKKGRNKQCICSWGDKCRKWTKALTKKGHEWGGFVKLSVSDSCEFENSWGAISTLIIPSAEDTEKIFNKHESAKSNTVTPPSGKGIVEQCMKCNKWYHTTTMANAMILRAVTPGQCRIHTTRTNYFHSKAYCLAS